MARLIREAPVNVIDYEAVFAEAIRFAGRQCQAKRDEADKKSLALLESWLTPQQLTEFRDTGSFVVEGGSTGKRYRINRPAPWSVKELNRRGHIVESLCFLPKDQSINSIGDIMLAQKLALEMDEEATLNIANYESAGGGVMLAGVGAYGISVALTLPRARLLAGQQTAVLGSTRYGAVFDGRRWQVTAERGNGTTDRFSAAPGAMLLEDGPEPR